MKELWPFNLVDVFGYLSQGVLLVSWLGLIAQDHPWGRHLDLETAPLNLGWLIPVVVVITSYIFGHVVSHISYLLFELGVVERLIGSPLKYIVGGKATLPVRVILLILGVSDYSQSYPEPQREKMSSLDVGHLSLRVFNRNELSAITDLSAERAEAFRNLYLFCRNSTLTLGVIGMFSPAVYRFSATSVSVSGIVLLLAAVMFGRYLRFLRFHVDELAMAQLGRE